MGTYTVEYIEDNGDFTDISVFVHTLDDTHFYSDGRIGTSALTLQASFGQFITDTRNGTTPIISQFDKIRLTYIDSDLNQYQHIYEVINDLGQVTRAAEYLLPLSLEGRERNLQLIPFSGFFDPPLTSREMAGKILEAYAADRNQDTQPLFITPINELPDFNPNLWDFQYIDNCLDALQEVLRQANLSVAAGGGGDRFAMIYKDSGVGPTFMEIDFISQGTNNEGDPFVTITGDPIFNPIQVVDKIKQPVTGTIKVARGRPGTGGTPRQGDQYRSRLEFYQRTQTYDNTKLYPTGAYVSHGVSTTNPEFDITPQVWQAQQETTGNIPVAGPNWATVSAFEFIGDIQYSPFTINKAALYHNECTNFEEAFESDSDDSPKMLDCNLVIDDVETQRDWVHFRAFSDEIADLTTTNRKYLLFTNFYYPGFRILVDSQLGTLAGSFDENDDNFGTGAGNDPNGKPYKDNAVIRIVTSGQNQEWFVMKEHESFDQVVVRQEGLFEFNVDFAPNSRFPASDTTNSFRRLRQGSSGSPNGWKVLNGQFLANDCLHSPTIIENVEGLITPVNRIGASEGGPDYTSDSAVRIVYEYGTDLADDTDIPDWRKLLDNISGIIRTSPAFLNNWYINAGALLYSLFLTPQYRNAGWWITFSAPWPLNTGNQIDEQVGELYGGTDFGELQNHSFFDVYNQRVAYSGKDGWNQPDSADLMEITGVTFLFNLDIQKDNETIPWTGDIPCSYWVIDTNGTIWKQKKNIRFLKDTQRLTFNFGDFSPVYRARSPFGISNIVTNILVPELEIRERVLPARIQMQGFMLELAYDEHGRYLPNLMENFIKPTVVDLFFPGAAGINVKFDGTFDYLQWIKTPIAIENGSSLGETPDRSIFPEFTDYPNISNLEQLQRAATADWEIAFFQYEQYTLTQNDRAENSLQDTVYMREEFLIPEGDQELATTNAWVTATEYILNDIVNNGGTIFEALEAHLSSGANEPPSAEWRQLGSRVPNTREVVVGEIALSVTNGKDWERNMTLVRRIPKRVS